MALAPRALSLWNKARKADRPKLWNMDGARGMLNIYGVIGEDITDRDVADALTSLAGATSLDLYVNSPGGDYFQGKAIYAQLQRCAAAMPVTAYVDSLAASAASLLLMAAGRVQVAPEASIMIHEVHCYAFGRAADLDAQAALVRAENTNLASIYAKRTGLEIPRCADLMAAETWFTAQEACDYKFADAITADPEPVNPAQDAIPVVAPALARLMRHSAQLALGLTAMDAPPCPCNECPQLDCTRAVCPCSACCTTCECQPGACRCGPGACDCPSCPCCVDRPCQDEKPSDGTAPHPLDNRAAELRRIADLHTRAARAFTGKR